MATCLILAAALTVSMFQLQISIELDCIVPKVLLQLHDFKTSSTTDISIHDLFFGQCGDAMLAPHRSMGSKAALSCIVISCPGWISNHANVKVLPFDHGPSESLTTCASRLKCLPFDHGPDQLSTSCQADNPIPVKSQRPAPFAFQILFSSLPFA